jgi:hypothetical protein
MNIFILLPAELNRATLLISFTACSFAICGFLMEYFAMALSARQKGCGQHAAIRGSSGGCLKT